MKRIIIHTNKYAGNFEREMCAYITGHYGECGVGSESVEEKYTTMFEPYILQMDEENKGCRRPVIIYPNPRYSNNGLGYSFDSSSLEESTIAQDKHIEYIKNDKLAKLYETLEFYKGTRADVTYYKEQIESVEKEISDYASIPPLEMVSYPSYQSVCIYVKDDITDELLEVVKERANSFHSSPSRFEHRTNDDIIIEGVEVISDTPVSIESSKEVEVISDTIKVKVTAYKEQIVIETIDPDTFDKDYSPNGNGRMGCSLSNTSKLGISAEALSLLKQVSRNRDAVGDFMGDSNSFGWWGGTFSIKNLKSQGARDFEICNHVVIDNDVSDYAIGEVEKQLKESENNTVEYEDVSFEPWLELREDRTYNHDTKSYDSKDIFSVNICFHDSHLYDDDVEILNAPENSITRHERDGYSDIKFPKNIKLDIEEKISNIFGQEYNRPKEGKDNTFLMMMKKHREEMEGKEYTIKEMEDYLSAFNRDDKSSLNFSISKDKVMDYVNSFFDLGFSNNIMNPHSDYWRLSLSATPKDYLETLDKFELVP